MARKLKVFLSSTAQDLTAFRWAVHARLAASPLFVCIRQEDFGARPHPAVDTCRAQVLEADLFIGLIGMRRGWEPPDHNPTQRSITEMEYDWAKDRAPRFMYVAPEDFPVPGNLRETEDEHRRHLGFRQRIMGELVVSQNGFVSPEALAILIVDQLTHHVLNGDLVERARSQSTANDAAQHLPVAEQLLRLLEDRGMLKTAERGGLERAIVLKLAKRLKPDDTLDFERAVAELENAITVALDVIARGRRRSNEDDFVNEVLKEVATHTQAGENERAAKAVDDALKELDNREADQHQTFKRSRLTLLEAGVAQDFLRRDARSLAQRLYQVIVIQVPDDSMRFDTLRKKQDEYDVEGRDKGLNFSLEIAIELSRLCVATARLADQRGTALNDLGVALWELGERESGTARLNEAIAVYRDALKERTRERVPLDWAITQHNLGIVLRSLGERETDTARLNEAVTAFRAALEERKREDEPSRWASTQNCLGTALKTLGDREGDAACLEEAITAFREALNEYPRQREPLEWARTQHNLGAALRALGALESSTVRFEEAIDAYRAALEERTRDRTPLDWAMTQHNLGSALRALGRREQSTARLTEAVAAFRVALEVFETAKTDYYVDVTRRNLADAEALLPESHSSKQ